MRTSSQFEIGAINLMGLNKFVLGTDDQWHDADDAAECDGPDINPAEGVLPVDPLEDGRYRLVETRAPVGYQ